MPDANSKADIFLSSIKKYAVQQSDMMHNEAEQFKEKELQRIKNNAIEESNAMFAREAAAIRAKIAGETAEKYEDSRNALFQKRNEVSHKVYLAARERLLEFACSDRYSDYLKKCIDNVADAVTDTDFIVYIKQNDKICEDTLCEVWGNNCKCEVSDDIEIGGFMVYCIEKRIIINETLDEKLKNTREWFMENSGLKIL